MRGRGGGLGGVGGVLLLLLLYLLPAALFSRSQVNLILSRTSRHVPELQVGKRLVFG